MKTTIDVAQDLTAIVDMAERLEDQAINDANDHLMPGGLAMVALAGVANLEAWANKLDAAERLGIRPVIDDDDEWEPPLQSLLFWSDDLRRIHDQEFEPTPHRPRQTEATEANIIRHHLDWLWENEPKWDDFAAHIGSARARLEALLREGDRAERTRVVCDQAACEAGPPRLMKVYGRGDVDTDRWKCPRCKTLFDEDALKRAHAKQLRHEGAQRFVSLPDAIGTLRAQGRPERTIRKWLAGDDVESRRDEVTGQMLVWWPDLWVLHLTTKTRNRGAA